MRYRGYRIDAIIAIALLTVPVLIGGQTFYKQVTVERPLADELQTISGVKKAIIAKTPAGYDITLDLSAVDNLPLVYRQAVSIIKKHLNPSTFSLQLVDSRTPALENLYWQAQTYIEEAAMRGNFSAIATKLTQLATEADAQLEFYVDEECIYLELYQDPHYLYAVRERYQPSKEAVPL